MKQYELFFGFCLDEAFMKDLAKANPYQVSIFLGPKSEHLAVREAHGKRWAGKVLEPNCSTENLDVLQEHITSIARKLVPTAQFKTRPALLLAVESVADGSA